MAGMKAAGLGAEDQIDTSQEGRDAGLEITWAIQQADNLDYENISQVLAAMEIIDSDGSASLFR